MREHGAQQNMNYVQKKSADQRRRIKGVATIAALSVGLAACSSLPDWANPVEWYDTAFSDEAAPPPASQRTVAAKKPDAMVQAKPEAKKVAKKEFPALKVVPAEAPKMMPAKVRKKVVEGLVADRDGAKYTDEDLRSGGSGAVEMVKVTPKPVIKPVMKAAPAPTPVAVAPKPAAKKPMVVAGVDPAAPRRVKPRMPKLASSSRAPQPVVVTSAPPPPAPLPPLSPQSVTPQSVTPVAPQSVMPQSVMPKPVMPQPIAAAPSTPPPAPLPPLVAPVAQPAMAAAVVPAGHTAPSFPNAGQNTLAQIFAQSLAQSASTVSTAPAHSTFADPVAAPLKSGQYQVPKIVLEAYNTPLTDKSSASVTVTPGQPAQQTTRLQLFSGNNALNVQPGETVIVKFANGSAQLNAKSRAIVRKAAKAYKARGKGVIRVVGHASHRTQDLPIARHRMANFNVSLDRANAVARELMRQGVKASVVRVEAKSDSDPVFYEYMPAGEAENRRTEIFLGYQNG